MVDMETEVVREGHVHEEVEVGPMVRMVHVRGDDLDVRQTRKAEIFTFQIQFLFNFCT